ncbi:hypothetical protein GCM10020331_083760 [Ectobacillus funiculus]
MLYFEVVTTFALAIGLLIVNLVKPGEGINTSNIEGDVSQFTKQAAETSHGLVDFLMSIIPDNIVSAMAKG